MFTTTSCRPSTSRVFFSSCFSTYDQIHFVRIVSYSECIVLCLSASRSDEPRGGHQTSGAVPLEQCASATHGRKPVPVPAIFLRKPRTMLLMSFLLCYLADNLCTCVLFSWRANRATSTRHVTSRPSCGLTSTDNKTNCFTTSLRIFTNHHSSFSKDRHLSCFTQNTMFRIYP